MSLHMTREQIAETAREIPKLEAAVEAARATFVAADAELATAEVAFESAHPVVTDDQADILAACATHRRLRRAQHVCSRAASEYRSAELRLYRRRERVSAALAAAIQDLELAASQLAG